MTTRNDQDTFTRCRMIGEFEEGRCLPKVAKKFGINTSVTSRAGKTLQLTGTAVRKIGGSRHRKTTVRDDRYTVVQVK